jgi:tRNA-modifying protein YgfZ
MRTDWLAHLTKNGAVMENNSIKEFGHPQDELAMLDAGTIIADLSHFGLIRFSGEDAQKFLHGQLSNSVEKLDSAHAQFSSYNTPKGRMLATMQLWRDGADYLLMLPAVLREPIQKRLAMYVLRSKVKTTDASEAFALIGVSGPKAATLIAEIAGPLNQDAMGLTVAEYLSVIRLGEHRFVLAVNTHAVEIWDKLKLHATPVGEPVWRLLDIRAGIPWITPATQEQFVAQMANLDLIGGVDFKKGCYPGQEIVARTHYLGKLKRRMYLVHGDSVPAVQAGDELYSADFEGQASGMVVNSAPSPTGGYDALAVMQIDSAAAQTMHVKSLDGPPLKILPLPYNLA